MRNTEEVKLQENCKHRWEIKDICKDDGVGMKLVIGICVKCGKLRFDVL